MLIDFNETKEITIPGMNGGSGTMSARMFMDEQGKIIPTKIHPGGSIGLHKHETSDDINYVLSGTGKAILAISAKKAHSIALKILETMI